MSNYAVTMRPDNHNPVYATLMHPISTVIPRTGQPPHSALMISFSPWSIHAPFFDLPLPDPPSGWILAGNKTRISQTLYKLQFIHEIEYFLPANNENKSPEMKNPLQSTPTVSVPSNWYAVSGNLKVEKRPNQYKYIYTLEYESPLEPRVNHGGSNRHSHRPNSRFEQGGGARWV